MGDGRVARIRFTTRADGDLAITGDPDELAARRAALVDLPWTWLRQVHDARVVVVDAPGAGAGEEADGAVTATSGAVLAVHTADCGPIALVADGGAVAVAHAGWKGLAEGVVGVTVDRLRSVADGPVRAVVGPFIHPECYEFGAADLQSVVDRLGPDVEGRTSAGTPALDLDAGIRGALGHAGVTDITVVGGCTACGPDAFSHRARGDVGRQAVLAWIEDGGVTIAASTVAAGLDRVRDRILSVGGDPDRVTIVAVTKGFGVDAVEAALAAGATHVGENYAQELVVKAEALTSETPPTWHFIGGLQRNKVRALVPHVALWETVDRASLGAEVAKRAGGARVLVQVNISGEEAKGGCAPEATADLVAELRALGLDVGGLMGVAAAGDEAVARSQFARLATLRGDLGLAELSMGMSADLEAAVAEGATIVRVGRALFGARPPRTA